MPTAAPHARTGRRIVEPLLLWVLVFGGLWALLAALGHLGPNSIGDSRGHRLRAFDVPVGGLGRRGDRGSGIGTAWRRDGWLTAAVVVLAICYWGDAIGHVTRNGPCMTNTATNNVGHPQRHPGTRSWLSSCSSLTGE